MSVHDIIIGAANKYGVDSNALLAIAQLESAFNPEAQNPRSSAGGLFQFIDSTAEQYNLADRFDPNASADAGARLLRDNSTVLSNAIGRAPTSGELYLAHQQGATGATRLLSNPNAKAIDIVGRDAIELNGGDENMTAQEFANLWISKADAITSQSEPGVPAQSQLQAQVVQPEPDREKWIPVYDAYFNGDMDEAQTADYLSALQSGEIPSPLAPDNIYRAYMSGEMDDAQRAQFDSAIENDIWALPPAPETPALQEFGSGLLRGLGIAGRGAAQGLAGLGGVVSDPFTAIGNLFRDDQSQVPFLRNAVKNQLDAMGVPSADTNAEKIMQALYEGAGGGGGSAKIAQILSGGLRGVAASSASAIAANPASQTIAGATGAASAQFAENEGAGPIVQAVSGLAGGVAGAATPSIARRVASTAAPNVTPTQAQVAAQQAVDDAENVGIRVLTTDVFPPTSGPGQFAQRAGESVPILGTGGVRVAQQADRVNAVRKLLDDYDVSSARTYTDDIVEDFITTRGAELERLSTLKSGVFENVRGSGAVPVSRTTSAIDREISALEQQDTDNARAVIRKLVDWRTALQGKSIDVVDSIRDELGGAFKGANDLEARRLADGVVKRLYGPIKDDMGAFIQSNGGPNDYNQWRIVNNEISGMLNDLKISSLRNVLSKSDVTPETINRMLFSADRSAVKNLYDGLSRQGRAVARSAILFDVLEKAGGIDNLSPIRFANNLGRRSNQIGVFFSGQELRQARGLARALNLTHRASAVAANPATGQQNFIPALGVLLTGGGGAIAGGSAGAVSGAGSAIAGAAGLGLMARALESGPARNLFMALGRSGKGTAAESEIFKRLLAVLQEIRKEDE